MHNKNTDDRCHENKTSFCLSAQNTDALDLNWQYVPPMLFAHKNHFSVEKERPFRRRSKKRNFFGCFANNTCIKVMSFHFVSCFFFLSINLTKKLLKITKMSVFEKCVVQCSPVTMKQCIIGCFVVAMRFM